MTATPPTRSPRGQSRGGRQRAARRGLALGLALFVLANAGLSALLHTRLAGWREGFFGPRMPCLSARAGGEPRPRTVIVLGSSRAHSGVRAASLEERLAAGGDRPVVAFNLARPGAGPVMQLYTWRKMRRLGVRPDVLVLEATPFLYTENPRTPDLDEKVCPTATLDWQDLGFVARYDPDRPEHLRRDWVTAQALPWLAYRRVLLSHAAPFLLPMNMRQPLVPMVTASGDGPYWAEPRQGSGERLRQFQAHTDAFCRQLLGELPGRRQDAALRELLSECRPCASRVVVVLLPECRLFRKQAAADRVRAFEEYLARIAREYDLELVDARDWLGDDEFADGIHVNKRGAHALTDRLAAELSAPGPSPAPERRLSASPGGRRAE